MKDHPVNYTAQFVSKSDRINKVMLISSGKLYQINTGVLPIFDKYFGDFKSRNLSEICAVSKITNYYAPI